MLSVFHREVAAQRAEEEVLLAARQEVENVFEEIYATVVRTICRKFVKGENRWDFTLSEVECSGEVARKIATGKIMEKLRACGFSVHSEPVVGTFESDVMKSYRMSICNLQSCSFLEPP